MIKKELQKFYWQLLLPAFVPIIISECAENMGLIKIINFSGKRTLSIILLILAAFTAIALPLLMRTLFVNRVKDKKIIRMDEWFKYERQALSIVLITPYFFFIASFLQFNRFYYVTIFLLSLYGCYYYFPSQKRVLFEKRLFRIHEDNRSHSL